jgi:two-component system phosphate regulon sensor histidine kinase PhoR
MIIRRSSFQWLVVAMLAPLAALIILAALGARAQSRAAWEDLGREADLIASAVASRLGSRLQEAVASYRHFPDPPVPGTSSPMDLVLEGKDVPALLSLRDSQEAGISPAGLPRRALAALRIMELDPQAQQADEVVSLITLECPSILTELALGKLGPEGEEANHRWQEARRALGLVRSHPEGGWISESARHWWLTPGEQDFQVITPDTVDHLLQEESSALDRPGFKVSLTNERNRPPEWKPLGFAAVPFGKGLTVEVSLISEKEVAADIIRKQVRGFSMVALAAAVSAWGLFLIHRTLRRERQLNEMKSQFVASVSHELRAPVASIRLMADALEEGKLPPETVKEFHRLISREGARLSTLVGNVLDHSRIERGLRTWKKEPCDLSPLIQDTLRVMEPLAKEREIVLESSIAGIEASVDADAIQQALVNLLDNAIKFSPRGSTITTSLAADEISRTWTLAVQDQGPGIPKQEQSRIFERFYRPGDELRRETQGTGIGLSLVKAIAEAHSGTVTVDSQPGHGSTFTLRIPISP